MQKYYHYENEYKKQKDKFAFAKNRQAIKILPKLGFQAGHF